MTIEEYKKQKKEKSNNIRTYRTKCFQCFQPDFSCYCKKLRPIDCGISFVVLIHPLEVRRRVATGRMAYLSLEKSHIVRGDVYTQNKKVNGLLGDDAYQSAILYPSKSAYPIDETSDLEIREKIFKNKKPRVFVIDGTWGTARKTFNQSENFRSIPKIAFTPKEKSRFRVRKQPKENCFSSIEAIHKTIDIMGNAFGFDVQSRKHDYMLSLFDTMVEQQLELTKKAYAKHGRDGCYRTMKRRSV